MCGLWVLCRILWLLSVLFRLLLLCATLCRCGRVRRAGVCLIWWCVVLTRLRWVLFRLSGILTVWWWCLGVRLCLVMILGGCRLVRFRLLF